MTATDELRRMLDERGVEWSDSSDENVLHTTWGNMNCWFNEFHDGWTSWGMAMGGTPEQAIAATLGDAFTREECEASFVHGYSLGTLPVGSDPQWDENRQTVDEHMAELGWVRERTCIAEENRDASYGDCMYVCSECGADFDNEEFPKYCPDCGARVVSE